MKKATPKSSPRTNDYSQSASHALPVRQGPRALPLNNDTTTKVGRVLALLVAGYAFNRYDAALIGDTCLHTTISALSNNHGVKVMRIFERVPNRFNSTTPVCCYWIEPEDREHARQVLKRWLKKQGASND